jgi:hypothetical protein
MKDLNHVIHESSNADLDKFVYTEVYAGVSASPIINGRTINMVAGTSIEILITSISANSSVYVLGRKRTLAPIIINK